MDPTNIGLFRLAEQRMAWAGRRQELLAQNIANANTPGYTARDLQPFERALSRASPGMTQTNPLHLSGAGAPGAWPDARQRPHERAPDGNAVSVEEQLTKVADTASAHELTSGLYRKYMGMFRTALGRAG